MPYDLEFYLIVFKPWWWHGIKAVTYSPLYKREGNWAELTFADFRGLLLGMGTKIGQVAWISNDYYKSFLLPQDVTEGAGNS